MSLWTYPFKEDFGAEVRGLDLRAPMQPHELNALREAWSRHLVLVVRGQKLTPEEHIRFGRYFGELLPHPVTPAVLQNYPEIYVLANIIDDKPDHRPPRADFWHTDLTYTARPSRAGILCAREIPSVGGDTLFANMQRAFATLPAALQARLMKLEAVHGLAGFGDRYARITGEGFPSLRASLPEVPLPNVTHPVVIRHPDTGKHTLFVNPGFTIRFVGMSDRESESLLDELISHTTEEHNIYRHKWEPDDIVIWDNFSTMDMATGGYVPPMRRVMHRLTVGGPAVEPVVVIL